MNTENIFESLFENSNHPSLICTTHGKVVRLNERAKKCLISETQEISDMNQLFSSWNPDVQTDSIFVPTPKPCIDDVTPELMEMHQFNFQSGDEEYIWVYFQSIPDNEVKNSIVESWHPKYGYHGLLANDGTVLHASNGALELIEKPLKEVVGIKFWESPWFNHENSFRRFVRKACVQSAKAEFIRFELNVAHEEGKRRVRHFVLRPVFEENIVANKEVTENNIQTDSIDKEVSNQRLLNLIESTKDIVASADKSGRLFYLNQAGRSMLQIEPNEDISKYCLEDLHNAEVASKLREVGMNNAAQFGCWTGETTWRRKDGSEFTTIQSIIGHCDENKNVLHFSTLAKDISHQKNIEKLLQAEKQFSESLLNSMHDGYSLLNGLGEVIDVNEALCQMTGYKREEIVGQKIPLKHWTEESKEEIKKIYLSLGTSQNEPFEAMFQHKNGELFPVLISPTVIRNADGQTTFHFNTIKNITEFKKVVQKLTETQSFIETILRTTPCLIYILDLNSQEVVFTNHSSIRLLGYNDEELKKMGPNYFMQLLHPDEINELSDFFSFMKTVQDNEVVEREYRMRHKNGEYRYFRSYNSVFRRNENNEVVEVGGSSVDITENKKNEIAIGRERQRLTALIEKSHDIFVITSPERLQYVSSNVIDILGYSPEEFAEVPLDLFLHPDDFPPKWDKLNTPGSSMTIEYRAKHKNGSWRWIEAYGTNLMHMDSIRGLVFNLHDITDRKNHELMLAQLANRLELKNEQLEQFNYIASHDLQEPLRTMISCVDVLLQEFAPNLDEEPKQFLSFIKQSSERMTALINGLLCLGRVGKEEEPKLVNMNELTDIVLSDLSNAIQRSNATIDVGELPTIHVQYDEMRMLLQNLISNAIKFSQKDATPTIKIGAKKKSGQDSLRRHWYWPCHLQENSRAPWRRNMGRL
jgi:PAS domain S-box-containing protein